MDVSEYAADQTKNCKLFSKIPEMLKGEPCFLGIDEAGRGPVLGPMVYATCFCPLSCKEKLANLGCDDSKALKEEQRDELFQKLDNCTDDFVGWIINILSPNYISTSMLSRTKYNLNSISHDTAIDLIKSVQNLGIELKEVYVDTVGSPVTYTAKLKERFPSIDITVESKADATYPIVSAASICAKVCRDKTVKNWKFSDKIQVAENYGSGYPSDPSTKAWLRQSVDPVFGFPDFVRFSWSTAKNILEDEAVAVEWPDEEEEEGDKKSNTPAITSFFSNDTKKRNRHTFFKENHLNTVGSF
uniref:ribonuclease H2 subunit A-like n=1 Tax=Styela clava TaxID=7725 RepID=UPI001939C7F0|nr:ribonuclease H2 subunit A-like [Styela clava]XP_039258788.1 ribonuclease H2 subunit A-like [Styela clava]